MTTAEATSPAFLGDAEFVQEELLGLLAANGRTTSGSYRFELVDSEDPTKITAEYRLDDGSRLFAKLYSGGDEDGGHCYAVMRALWEGGFGPTSRYRVAEPLGYLPERRVLVTREAHGTCVVDHLGTDSAEQFGGVRECARWLGRLHAVPMRLGPTWSTWRNFHRLARRFLKASATRPQYAQLLAAMLERLAVAAPGAEGPSRIVQTHGQFRDLHVYVDEEAVSVIDFDRSLPADPAKDLDEFLHRLRWKTFKRTGRRADDLSAAFLSAYEAEAPAENVQNLGFYAGYHALFSLARHLHHRRPEDAGFEEGVAFYTGEFDMALSGTLTALAGP